MKKTLATRLITTLPHFKAQIFRLSWFTLAFGFVKFNAFTAALILSNFVGDVADYGLFEYALSVGFMIAIPLDFGLNGAYPYFNLRLGQKDTRAVFFFHAVLMGSVALGLFWVNQFLGGIVPEKLLLALLIGGVVSIQALSSAMLKSHEILLPAVLADGGLFLVLNGYNLWLYLSGNAFDPGILKLVFTAYLLFLTAWQGWLFWQKRATFSLRKYREVLRFGKHLVLSAFLIICLTGSARLFIEWFLGLEEVGYYGFYFRFAAVTVMLHQIVNIVFFKKMYQSDGRTLDRYFAMFLLLLVGGGLLLWAVIPAIFRDYLQLLASSFHTYKGLYFILTFQMICWIALALNENIIYREGLSAQMNRGFILLIALMVAVLTGMHALGILDVFRLTIVNMMAIFAAVELQSGLLRHKGIDLPLMRHTCRGILLLFWILYVFMI
ncbi:MAG: hypothetical protein D6714_08245 [Bacteroidetes bacterium]|nr:MAG: hypothetical protein D6714_08245 [Bacteroidota bacterium]